MKRDKYMLDRALSQVQGLIVVWDDPDPARSVESSADAHIIPRSIETRWSVQPMADYVFSRHWDWLLKEHPVLWCVDATVIYGADSGEKYETGLGRLDIRDTVNHLTDYFVDLFRNEMRRGDVIRYETTRFKIECLGK